MLVLIIVSCSGLKPLKLDPDSREFYNYAQHLFTKHEGHIFRNLNTKEAREKFIGNFWKIRDPGSGINEFKVEIERRIEYIKKYFREGHMPGWKTDRGMIYLVLGPPFDQTTGTVLTNSRMLSYIHWFYGLYTGSDLFIRFIGSDSDGIFRLDVMHTSLDLLSKLEDMKYQVLSKESDIFEKTKMRFNAVYDGSAANLNIFVNPDGVIFERKEDKVTVKFRIKLVVYPEKGDFFRQEKTLLLELREEEVTGKGSRIAIPIPLQLDKGKYKVDVLVTDLFGDRTKRKFITIKPRSAGSL